MMKSVFLNRIILIAIIAFVTGVLIILFSIPLSHLFYTVVEESGASYTITSTDERSALLFMINLNVVGTLISIAGLTGLIFIGNRYYDELKSVSK
ncbi:hypothetical protein [Turicibacter sanguinis]|uniref:Uncharacterized protein n=2 Tax=Turicibacter sanguinis TaxID=154288 RepID=A0A6G2CHH3_9FIRM|nr:hypothetical protein [Turicibacter sanguinis]KAB3587134.1 hypothetical protein GAY13_23615 [Phocaeicola vulgatus]DAN56634.1 MAG TPA: hypothetical protein [Caudoviricetes sp.]MDB8564601.1 hypothetical protein [Turicibacter sanguinis]MDB8576429.1 hypothetical protein [Turicibacter sanguinis]MDB8585099.1 hypothetical protein [Turicibacter sanguinis]